MKKKLSALLVCLLSVVLAFALVACGGGTLTISDTSLSLTVGDTKQLTLKEGENDVTKDAKWESSDAKVVTVDSRGNVVAKAAGSATVTGTYNSASAKCEVTVTAKEVVTVAITDESGKEIKELTVDRDASVNVKATTSNGSKVTWAVSDAKYAVVEETADNAAKITGKLKTPDGSPVTVYATSGSARASLALTVTFANAPAGYYDLTGPNDNGSIGQNKVEQGKWAYWADMTGWNGGSVDIQVAEYLGEKAGSEAGTVHFKYNASSFGNYPDSCVQLTYRNLYDETARPNGLKTAGYYKLTCKITSDAAGTLNLNGTDIELKVGDNNVTVYFQHNDTTRVYKDDEYDNIYYTAIFLTAGQRLPAAELTLTDFKWEEFTPATLNTPTVTVSGGKVTIADDNTEGVASYNLGLFVGEQQVYVVPGAQKGANDLDLSKYEEGEYAVKAQAVGGDARYVTSAWSDGSVTLTVSHNGKTEYDVIDGTEAQAKAFPGLWYYSSEYSGLKDVKYTNNASATNPYGEVSFEVTDGGSWYSNQFFFVNSRLAAGRYVVKFTIKASEMEDEAKIHINGKLFTVKNGDNAIEYRVEQNVGVTTISIQMGEPSGDYQSTVSAIAKGKFTLTGFSFEAAVAEKLATPTKLEIAEDGTVTVTDAASNAGKVSGYKLIFVDASGATKAEKVVKNGDKLNVNTIPNGTYTIKVVALGNGVDWTDSDVAVLKEGFVVEHENGPIEMDFGGEADEGSAARTGWAYWNDQNWNGSTVIVSEAIYELKEDGTFDISAKFSAAGTCNWGFQLYYNDGAYEIGTKYQLTLTATAATDCTVTFNGKAYPLKAGAPTEISVEFTYNYHPDNVVNYDAGLSLFDMQAVVEDGKSYELTLTGIKWEKVEGGEQPQPGDDKNIVNGEEKRESWTGEGTVVAVEHPDTWVYWNDQNYDNSGCTVTVSKHELVDGVAYFTYSTTGTNWYGFQVFYEKSGLTAGTTYTLTLVLHSNVAGKVTINNKQFDIVVGDNNLTVTYTEGAEASFKLIMGTTDGAEQNPVTTFIASAEISLKDLAWTEQGGTQPETPAGDKEITVTPTEWYGDRFVKLSMSAEDLTLVGSAANCKVNDADVQPHGDGKGFLVDGTVLQVQLPDVYAVGTTYSVVWYDAQGNAIAHATFTYQQA